MTSKASDPVFLKSGYSKKELDELTVAIKSSAKMGNFLVANRDLRKGQVVAYYRLRVYREEDHSEGPYTIAVYTKSGNMSRTFVGDIPTETGRETTPRPRSKIPYWAHLSNEPSKVSQANCEMDSNIKDNYTHRRLVREGDFLVYRLIATKNIAKGDPILWCYGDSYDRHYETECAE